MLHRYVCIDEINDENYMEDSAPEESIFRVSSNTAGWGCATFRHFLLQIQIKFVWGSHSSYQRPPPQWSPDHAAAPSPLNEDTQVAPLFLIAGCVLSFQLLLLLFFKWQIWVYKKKYEGGKEEKGAIDILHTKCIPYKHQTLYNRGKNSQSINARTTETSDTV